MRGALSVTLGVLVWKGLITIEQANKMDNILRDELVPNTIEQIVDRLEEVK